MDFSNSQVYFVHKTFVFDDEGRFLILMRSKTAPTRPNTWDLPGGAYEKGQTPDESAKREIREEAGIEVVDLTPLALGHEENDSGEYWVKVAYRARALSTEVTLSFEHSEYRWVTPAEFLELESAPFWKQIAKGHLL